MTGVVEFADQAAALGLPGLESEGNWVLFDLEVPAGRFAGETRRIAVEIPEDFPVTPPPGPHVSPATTHPAGAVHASSRGAAWVYWSRPVPDWATDRSVRAWIRHVRSVFAQIPNE